MKWPLDEVSYVHEVEIDSTPATIMRLISTLQFFEKLHPTFIKVKPLKDGDQVNGRVVSVNNDKSSYGEMLRYEVRERLSFLSCLSATVTYRLNILQTDENKVVTAAFRSFGIKISTVWTLQERDGSVVLREEILVRAPKGIKWYVYPQALNGHVQLLQRIKAAAESDRRPSDKLFNAGGAGQ